MNELKKIESIIEGLMNTSSGLGTDVVLLISSVKRTLQEITEHSKELDETELCTSCSGLRDTVKVLIEAIVSQEKYTQTFERALKQRESEIASQRIELESVRKELYTDKLTSIPNRNRYEIDMDSYIEDFKVNGSLFSYSLLDIDFFKRINDEFGHNIGDLVLTKFAREITEILTTEGLIGRCGLYRIGGEEFVLMGRLTKRELFDILERIRELFNNIEYTIKDKRSEHFGKKIKIAFSAGVSQFKESSSKQEIYENTDALLYKSKHNGRNKTTIEEEPSPIEIEKV